MAVAKPLGGLKLLLSSAAQTTTNKFPAVAFTGSEADTLPEPLALLLCARAAAYAVLGGVPAIANTIEAISRLLAVRRFLSLANFCILAPFANWRYLDSCADL